jgi:hypothetical protein
MGDPWDHPALLAKIDDLCSSHFQNKKTDAPMGLRPGPTAPAPATQSFTQPVPPASFETDLNTFGGVHLGAPTTSLKDPPVLLDISQTPDRTDLSVPQKQHSDGIHQQGGGPEVKLPQTRPTSLKSRPTEAPA